MIKTGLFKRGSNLHPKIERTKKGELIYVFADGSWKYYWEWIATAPTGSTQPNRKNTTTTCEQK